MQTIPKKVVYMLLFGVLVVSLSVLNPTYNGIYIFNGFESMLLQNEQNKSQLSNC